MSQMPPHVFWTMRHNAHARDGLTVEEAIFDNVTGYKERHWISDAQKQLSLASGEHYSMVVQWYETGKRFTYSAASLNDLFNYLATQTDRDRITPWPA